MKTLFSLFLSLLSCTLLIAQSKAYTGYYISTSGDSVFGSFPDFKQWNFNPRQVLFAPANGSAPLQLTPANCTRFEISGQEAYQSFTGSRLLNPITDTEIFNDKELTAPDDQYGSISSFLRIIATNSIGTLYAFKDAYRTNFFLQIPGQPIQELRFKMYEQNNQIREIREYRQQLYNAFRDKITSREQMQVLEKLPYEEEDLQIFMEVLQPFPKKKRKKNPAAGWLVGVGVSVNGMHVTGDRIAIETAHKYNHSLSPLLSLGYMLPVGRNFNRYFFYPKLSVQRYEISGATIEGNLIYQTRYQSNLVFAGMLQGGFHFLNRQPYKAFLSLGAGMVKLYNNKEVSTNRHVIDNSVYNQYETPISKITYQFNLMAGCSIRQKFFAMASFQAPSPVANFVYYNPQLYSYQFSFGYHL